MSLTTDYCEFPCLKEYIYFPNTLSYINSNIYLWQLTPAHKSLSSRSTFDNLELLKDGLSGALVTGLIIGVHEIGHILAAKESGIKLGVPYFVPSWQVKRLLVYKIFYETCLQDYNLRNKSSNVTQISSIFKSECFMKLLEINWELCWTFWV